MSLSCILIDNVPDALEDLDSELEKFSGRICVVRHFRLLKAACAWMLESPVDVVFLSLDMCGDGDIEIVGEILESGSEIVFIAADRLYPVSNFRRGVSACLLKPIMSDDLGVVISRIEKKVLRSTPGLGRELPSRQTGYEPVIQKKIKLTLDRKVVLLNPEDLLYCESDGNYCKVILENDRELFLTRKLKQVEELLPSHLFYRVHNSFLINLRKVKEFHKSESVLLLENGTRIPVSRQKKEEVLEKL